MTIIPFAGQQVVGRGPRASGESKCYLFGSHICPTDKTASHWVYLRMDGIRPHPTLYEPSTKPTGSADLDTIETDVDGRVRYTDGKDGEKIVRLGGMEVKEVTGKTIIDFWPDGPLWQNTGTVDDVVAGKPQTLNTGGSSFLEVFARKRGGSTTSPSGRHPVGVGPTGKLWNHHVAEKNATKTTADKHRRALSVVEKGRITDVRRRRSQTSPIPTKTTTTTRTNTAYGGGSRAASGNGTAGADSPESEGHASDGKPPTLIQKVRHAFEPCLASCGGRPGKCDHFCGAGMCGTRIDLLELLGQTSNAAAAPRGSGNAPAPANVDALDADHAHSSHRCLPTNAYSLIPERIHVSKAGYEPANGVYERLPNLHKNRPAWARVPES